jgi:hypothetical protein
MGLLVHRRSAAASRLHTAGCSDLEGARAWRRGCPRRSHSKATARWLPPIRRVPVMHWPPGRATRELLRDRKLPRLGCRSALTQHIRTFRYYTAMVWPPPRGSASGPKPAPAATRELLRGRKLPRLGYRHLGAVSAPFHNLRNGFFLNLPGRRRRRPPPLSIIYTKGVFPKIRKSNVFRLGTEHRYL